MAGYRKGGVLASQAPARTPEEMANEQSVRAQEKLARTGIKCSSEENS